MNNSPTNHRYDGIQALRFFAALLVVVTHSTFYAAERLGVGKEIWHNGARGVDIFFIISGVVMVISSRRLIENEEGWKIFATKRLQRIVPLYWGATTFKVITVLLMSSLVLHAEMDWWTIFKSYLFIPSINLDGDITPFLGVGWTLVFEMFFYFVFAAALFFRKNIYVFAGAVLLVFSFASLLRGETFSPWWYLMDSIILEFYAGMVIGYFALKRKFWPSTFSILVGLLALAFLLLSTDIDHAPLPRFIWSGIPAAIIVWSVMSLEKYLHGRIPRGVMFFGAASYALYLFHPLIAPFAPMILSKLSLRSFPLSVLFSLAISMVAAAFIHRWIELPFNNLIYSYQQRLSKKPQESS
ncbi:MAG: acyltransferase [Phormidesmis sp.]